MKESPIQKRLMLAVGSRDDVRLFRNSTGVAFYPDGRTVRFGLAVGSGDLIGIHRLLVTPSMVGRHIGRFVSVETKSDKGKTTEAQDRWLAMVRRFGGVACVARSTADAVQALDGGLFD